MTRPARLFPALFFPLALASGLRAADVTPPPAKSAVVAEKKTPAEYDAEAKLRISNFTLPEDIRATLHVDGSQTQNPSAICFDRQGRLYIAEIHRWREGVQDIRNEQRLLHEDLAVQTNADRLAMYEKDAINRPLAFFTAYEDRIVRTEDTDGDGRADKASVFADGFRDILDGPGIGLMEVDGSIWYTNIPKLWKLTDADGDGKAEQREVIQDGFGPRMSLSGHDMHGLIQGPDGKIYWSIGDRGYSITTREGRHYHRPMEGAVFRCDPDGSNLEEFHRGLRNPQELAFDAFGNLFTCDNDADSWDTGRLVYVIEGGNSGWNHGHQALLIFRDQLGLRTPDYQHPGQGRIPMNPWMTEGLWEPQHEGRPDWALPPIDKISWGPSGLVYNYGSTALPDRYAGHFWVCNFGGGKGDLETFAVEPSGAGFTVKNHHVFMVGLGNTDVEFGPDGRMYLSCFNNSGWYKEDTGNVYALFHPEAAASEAVRATHALLTGDLEAKPAAELDALLAHADLRVRQRAQFALVKVGAADRLTAAAQTADHQLKRLHGIWGLGMLAKKDETHLDTLIGLLTDADAEVRAQAARTLADSRNAKAGQALVAALDDASPRVQTFAAIGVGKCRVVTGLDKLLETLAENDNRDVFLRHGCVQGLWWLNEREKILKKVDDPSAAVRLGVLLALRQLEDPRVAYFLGDPEKRIRHEAIRAINDLDLPTVQDDLAAELDKYVGVTDGDDLPRDHRDQIIQLRLINANFRLGQPENATRLLAYAANARLPELVRDQALLAIGEWSAPTAVDATVGIHRPLSPASRADIAAAVKAGLPAVVASAEGHLLARAIEIGLQYGTDLPTELLTKQLTQADADLDVRIESLRALGKRKDPALEPLWPSLLQDKAGALRAAAVETLLAVDPGRGIEAGLALAESADLGDLQNAYRLLAPVKDASVTTLFDRRLDRVSSKTEPAGALLDLIEAVESRQEAPLTEKLSQWKSSLDPADPLAPFRVALEGGSVKHGETLFQTHAVGQCSKCHKVGGTGAEAGPDLKGIATRGEPDYILESLVNPSAKLVPGYGVTLVTLKNGESIGGTLMKEDAKAIVLKLPNPEKPSELIERTIPLADIATRQPPISAMPPMGLLLTKRELRDLVAYLRSLK
ncbi:MAG: HEAT repeat domain-containing protein [Verrucomicrobiales bacterium]|nr:HEAT repeat domain-containing protein [Verrucomicrobiales bacterium]